MTYIAKKIAINIHSNFVNFYFKLLYAVLQKVYADVTNPSLQYINTFNNVTLHPYFLWTCIRYFTLLFNEKIRVLGINSSYSKTLFVVSLLFVADMIAEEPLKNLVNSKAHIGFIINSDTKHSHYGIINYSTKTENLFR